jgi:hypothetical protein
LLTFGTGNNLPYVGHTEVSWLVEITAVEPSPPVAMPTMPKHSQLVNVITVRISVNRITECAEGEG